MEQAYPPGGENPSWGEVPEKNQQQQQQQKPPAMSQPTDQYRQKLRLKYGLPEVKQPCGDDCTECCCLPCCLAQQTGELNRLKYGLPEQSCGDYCTDCCCTDCHCTDCYCPPCCCLPCSLSQQTRELKSRGVDPNLGKKNTHKSPSLRITNTLSLSFSAFRKEFSFGFLFLFWKMGAKGSYSSAFPFLTRGVSHCGLANYIEKFLKANEEVWKLKYSTMQNYNLQKIF
jgi:hypothetical protein